MHNDKLEINNLTIDTTDISVMRKFRYLLYTNLKKRNVNVIYIQNLNQELVNTKSRQKEFNRVLLDAKKYTSADIVVCFNN